MVNKLKLLNAKIVKLKVYSNPVKNMLNKSKGLV